MRRCGCFLTEPCPSVSPTIMRGFRRNKDLQHKLKCRAIGLIAQPRYVTVWPCTYNLYSQEPNHLKKFPYLGARECFSLDDMGGVQFFASLIRLSQYSGVWLYGYFAVKYYHAVRKLPQLRGAPYEDTIYPSHMLNFALVFYPLFRFAVLPF